MAKRSPTTKKASKPKKRYPVQRHATVRLASPAADGLIHGNRVLSRLNKRLYRQGRFYQMKIDIDLTVADTGNPIEVFALRDTWGNHQAYMMGFDVYQQSVANEKSRLSKDQVARWQDFTVESGSSAAEMLPGVYDASGAITLLSAGEFLDTQVEDVAGNTMQFTWGADVAGSKYGLIAQYEKKANQDNDPSTVAGASIPYDTQLEDISDVESDQLQNRGNAPPYDSNLFGDRWVKVATLSRVAGQQRLSTGFFTAPCGFAIVSGLNGLAQSPISIEFKAGDYKGVQAPSMME